MCRSLSSKSFVYSQFPRRWKQRDIHEKREARKHRISHLRAQIACNNVLLPRIKDITERLENPSASPPATAYFTSLVEQLTTKPSPDCPPGNDPTKLEQTYDGMLLSLLRQVSEDAKAKFKDAARSEKEEKIAKELTELMAGHVKHLGETIKKDELELEKEEQEQKKHITSDDIHEGFESKVFNFHCFLASNYRTQQQRSTFLPNQSRLQYHTLGLTRKKKRRKLLSMRCSIQRPQLRPQPTPKLRRMKKMPTSQSLRHHWKRFPNSLFTATNNLSISFRLTAMSTFLVHLTLSWLPLSKHRAKGNRSMQSSVSTKVCSCSIVRNWAATVLVYSSRSMCLIFGLVVVPSFTSFLLQNDSW